MTPHSALEKSGAVSAAAFAHLLGQKYDVVVILAPSHSGYFPGVSIFDGESYRTPLGSLEVDRKLAEEMSSLAPALHLSSRGHSSEDREFTIEVTLPFLQLALGSAPILPVITGDTEIPTARALGDALYSSLKGRNALVIVSTDLSHYYDSATATAMDQLATQMSLAVNPEKLINLFQAKRIEACGIIGLIAALIYAQRTGVTETEQALYQQSDVSDGEVIGHSALVFTRSARKSVYSAPKKPPKPVGAPLSDEERAIVLRETRRALKQEFERRLGQADSAYSPPPNLPHTLSASRGAFVTIKARDGSTFRSGTLSARNPLLQTVCDSAIAAVFENIEDVSSLSADWIDSLSMTVQLVSPLKRITSPDELNPATQGALVKLEMHTAFMFPQEFKSGEERLTGREALEQVCLKAELPRRSYTDPLAEVYLFDVETIE